MRIVTVSYTHLDVYKRQSPITLRGNRSVLLFAEQYPQITGLPHAHVGYAILADGRC